MIACALSASVNNRQTGRHQTYRNENGVALGAFILELLAQAAAGDACGLAHAGVHVLESSVDDRPDAIHERDHELGAALDGDAECEHTPTAEIRVRRGDIVLENLAERVEDLGGRQVRGQSVDNTES